MNKYLKIEDNDNVVTCLQALKKGDVIEVDGKEITINQDIGRFHKVAIKDLKKGDLVYKYGQIIGDMTEDARAGDFIHTHNVESTRGRGDK
ncbi:MAG: UxaA family hydrolase [Peptoniphilaceae bacterium]|nr:UxaA family hydrolase [Peptoniphilaceae bacterium]MDY6018973.1 UxaA family hydrolase [Anaerococcus sp.]